MLRNQETSLHHIVPISRWWQKARNSNNTIYLKTKIHFWLHTAFWNALPNEQIFEILKNPENKIQTSKREDLYELLWITSYHQIYLPKIIIIDLDKFYDKQLRTWQIKKLYKIKKNQKKIFLRRTTTEAKIKKIYRIARQTLSKDFSEKLLDIIN